MDETTRQLYKLFFKGEKTAVNEIVSRFREELILFVNCYVHDFYQAEDIVSDTFVKIIVKKPKIKNEEYFKTYVYRIAKNLSLDYLKRRKKEIVFKEDYTESFEDIVIDESKLELKKAIDKLSREYRLIVHLRYFDGFSVKEISEIVKKNKKYVYNVLERAKVKLRELLKDL